MKYIQSGYKGAHEYVNVVPLGDLHIGSPHFDYSVLKRELERIDAERENTRIIIMGDLIESATKTSVGAGVYEQQMMPMEQINKAVEILRPYADLIDGVVVGNHEQRIYKASGVDVMEHFCVKLGIPDRYLRYYGVVKYAWNKRCYNVAVWHGAGGGSTTGGAMNKIEKQASVVFADVFLMGHVHKRAATMRDLYVPDPQNGRINRITQHFVITGSALDHEDSYAEEMGLPPSTKGFPRIKLGGRTLKKGRRTKRLKEVEVYI